MVAVLLFLGTLEEEDDNQLKLDYMPATLHYMNSHAAFFTLLTYKKKVIPVEGALINNPKNNIYLPFIWVYNTLMKMDETNLEDYGVK